MAFSLKQIRAIFDDTMLSEGYCYKKGVYFSINQDMKWFKALAFSHRGNQLFASFYIEPFSFPSPFAHFSESTPFDLVPYRVRKKASHSNGTLVLDWFSPETETLYDILQIYTKEIQPVIKNVSSIEDCLCAHLCINNMLEMGIWQEQALAVSYAYVGDRDKTIQYVQLRISKLQSWLEKCRNSNLDEIQGHVQNELIKLQQLRNSIRNGDLAYLKDIAVQQIKHTESEIAEWIHSSKTHNM